MARRLAPLLVALGVLAAATGTAEAHPLGNFSVNHLTVVRVSDDRVDVRYVLDQAEIPTFRERGLSDAEVLDRKRDEVTRRLVLTVDGRQVTLRPAGPPVLTHPAGQGGLRTTRLELPLRAAVRGARTVTVRDGTFPDRVGWIAVQAQPGKGTAVRTAAPATDPTGGLRRYPEDLLASPSREREASFSVRPGSGTLDAGAGRVAAGGDGGGGADGFAGVLTGDGVLVLLLLAAFGWGAVHALSPGHGKAMVAAYLVGTRGSTRDAIVLGATVTVTHTAGVIALGAVALGLSAWVLPEQLYPWLTLASGLMVVSVGAAVLRGRLRGFGHAHGPGGHRHDHGHDHHHEHDHDHHAARARPSPRPRGQARAPAQPARAGRVGRADPLPVRARGPARRGRAAPHRPRARPDRRVLARPGGDADRARDRGRPRRAAAVAPAGARPDHRRGAGRLGRADRRGGPRADRAGGAADRLIDGRVIRPRRSCALVV